VALALLAVAIIRGGQGWPLRSLVLAVLMAALANPQAVRVGR